MHAGVLNPHMGKSRVQTRVPDDLKDRLEEYEETQNISEADAVRRLIRVGLDREEQTVPDGGEVMDRLDDLEQRQEEMGEAQSLAQKRQSLAILIALAYIGLTTATDLSGLGWGLAGVVTIVLVWVTTLRVHSTNE